MDITVNVMHVMMPCMMPCMILVPGTENTINAWTGNSLYVSDAWLLPLLCFCLFVFSSQLHLRVGHAQGEWISDVVILCTHLLLGFLDILC